MANWFTIKDVGISDGKVFSCFTNTDQCTIEYDILYMEFKLTCTLQWFEYSWRRRKGQNTAYVSVNTKIGIGVDELLDIPLFKAIEESDKRKKIKLVIQRINEDAEIKQALVREYKNNFGIDKIDTEESRIKIHRTERFCDYEAIDIKTLLGKDTDDYSELKDIESCILKPY